MPKGSYNRVPTVKGEIRLIVEGEQIFLESIPASNQMNWIELAALRNLLTKMIDNKRARDRYNVK